MKLYPTLVCCILTLFVLQSFAQTPTPAPDAVNTEIAKSVKLAAPKGDDDKVPAPATGSSVFVRRDAPVNIPRFETAPVIDGEIKDEVWRNGALFGDFYQTQPGDNTKPSHPTEVMIGYDAKNLYIAFKVTQDRNTVRATIARRDNIFEDDYIGLYLDTFNDKRQAYTVFFNPLGIQADGTMTEGRGEDYSVDLVMESKGVLTPDGFTIEVAIPFKSLRYEAGKDKQWGLQIFRRVKYANGELDSWMPNDRSKSGSLNKAGHITGLEGIETTRQLEINPSFTLSESGRRSAFTFNNDPAGRYVNDGLKGEFGMTAKFGLTPTTTLDFAYNPDFAQVEADAPVTSANQRFPIFFAEKRPFFLERIDMFRSGLNLVNTRAIVDPDIAVKLTGRQGKNTFGVLYASDNAPGNFSKDERQELLNCQVFRTDPSILCPSERLIDKNAGIGVLRYKRDIGKENSLGLFATSYNFVDKHNYTSGVDGRFRFDEKTTAEFQLVGTHSRRRFYSPDLNASPYRTGNGVGYRIYVERGGKNLYMNYMAEGRSNYYRADVGFTPRTDTNYLGSFIQYTTDKDPKKAIIYKQIWNETNIRYDWKGRTQYSITNTRGQIGLQKQTFIGVNFQLGYERVMEHEFGPRRTLTRPIGAFSGDDSERSANFWCYQVFLESTPTKKWYVFLFMDNTYGAMDYDLGAGPDFPRASLAAQTLGQNAPLDPGPGNQMWLESTIRYQPTTAFQTQLNFTKIRMVRHDTGLVAFDDNIFSSRSTYQFTRNTFARIRVDYSTLNKSVRPQVVLGWTPNPGTALYLGYSADMSYKGYNPYLDPTQAGFYEPGFRGNGHTLFIKASYLFKKSF
jgi:hypothetical protein